MPAILPTKLAINREQTGRFIVTNTSAKPGDEYVSSYGTVVKILAVSKMVNKNKVLGEAITFESRDGIFTEMWKEFSSIPAGANSPRYKLVKRAQ
ncbi:hypothetical protein [Ralstonia phage RP13]|nr:hypothetical protein [Ralstonia phage RP13]